MSLFKSRLWHYFISRLPSRTLTTQTAHGKFTYFNKDLIGRFLFVEGQFELDKIRQAHEILEKLGVIKEKNKILLDIGANIGTVCVPLVNEGRFLKALAFEPEPRNFSLLEKNVKQNHLEDKVKCFNLGLSDKEGTMSMVLSDDNFGDHRLSATVNETSHSVEVAIKSLDNLLKEQRIPFEDISLLWMDVQGHESFVFSGAKELIASGIPVVAEFWPFGMREANVSKEEYLSIAGEFFSKFYDLAEDRPIQRNISELPPLFEQYKGETFTDLLLLR